MKPFIFSLLTFLCFFGLASAQSAEIQVMQETLVLIKPEAVQENYIGDILSQFEDKNLYVTGLKMTKLSQQKASEFYKVHQDRPFYKDLVQYMSSGPIVAIVLEGNNAIARAREVMGATDPAKASQGTIRARFGKDIQQNAVHGSDSLENAEKEIPFFFSPNEIYSRY